MFSYILATTVNRIIKLNSFTGITSYSLTERYNSRDYFEENTDFDKYSAILESGFFKIAEEKPEAAGGAQETDMQQSAVDFSVLNLMGTISGPRKIARAIIKNRSMPARPVNTRSSKDEKSRQVKNSFSDVYRIGDDVYGYQLVRIDGPMVWFKYGDDIKILDMYDKKKQENRSHTAASTVSNGNGRDIRLSRSEIQQKVFNNMDNALRGLRAGPYRENNKIEGYKLFRVRPLNILYKLGARSGDIVRRINGHKLDSTQKLISLWSTVKKESYVTVDIERSGKILNYQMIISD